MKPVTLVWKAEAVWRGEGCRPQSAVKNNDVLLMRSNGVLMEAALVF